jgi:hypothetical protein
MKVFTSTIRRPGAEATRSLHTTREGAYQAVVCFVEDYWDPEIIDHDIEEFGCNEDMVDYFFDSLEDDYQYEIAEEEVHGPEVAEEAPLGLDEVILSPQEVAACIVGLKSTKPETMAERLGLNWWNADDIAYSAYKKLKD